MRYELTDEFNIIYSSGTTGVPKCIVHSAGGTLVQHLKEHRFHCGLTRGEKDFSAVVTKIRGAGADVDAGAGGPGPVGAGDADRAASPADAGLGLARAGAAVARRGRRGARQVRQIRELSAAGDTEGLVAARTTVHGEGDRTTLAVVSEQREAGLVVAEQVLAPAELTLEGVNAILGAAADVAQRYLGVFCLGLHDLDVFLTTLFGELGHGDTNHVAVVGGVSV